MSSIVEQFFLSRQPGDGILEKTKITREGYIEVLPNRSCAEGIYLLKPAGKSLVVCAPNLNIRQPVKHIVQDRFDYFFISLCSGSVRGVGGAYIEKDKIYREDLPAGFVHRAVGVAFLPEFFDVFLNSRHGIAPDEIVQAINALGKLPPIPDIAVILKQISEASFTGDVGNIWIEAKALELVSIVLDWHRRLAVVAAPPLKEHDQLGIAEAIRYAEEHLSGPLTLQTLTRQAAMSMSKFTAAFKTHTGLSAASYIRRLRMDQAMYLLKNTTTLLKDIAWMVGYKHYSRFSALFREQFGVMPSEFRKRE
jgi:AraC-like DNA-binding protein